MKGLNGYTCIHSAPESSGGLDGKEFARNAGDLGSIPGSGRSPEKGNGNPLQGLGRERVWV